MTLFTVDDAAKLLPTLKKDKLYKKEIKKFSLTTRLFVTWFYIITGIRAFFIATIVVSLFRQQPDLGIAISQGFGVFGIIVYVLLSIIDLMRLLDIGVIIAVIVCSFTLGSGITANFVPYLLPLLGVFIIGFAIIGVSNYIFNKIVEKNSPMIYLELRTYAEHIENMQRMFK